MKQAILAAVLFATSAFAESADTINPGKFFGCQSLEIRNRIASSATPRDTAVRLLQDSVATGECVLFRTGEKVYVVDVKIFSGLIKVRRARGRNEYWTNYEATK